MQWTQKAAPLIWSVRLQDLMISQSKEKIDSAHIKLNLYES